jgi:energy-coupling factor transporter ATP-binding protein EcfA2
MNPLYSLKNITLKYPLAADKSAVSAVTAIDNLSLDIFENEFLAILGGNGSGKSSLAKLLAGLAGNYSGDIFYKGEPVINYDRDIFSDVAMILQEPQNQILMPSVNEEIAMPLENRQVPPEQITEKVNQIAGLFGLGEMLDKKTDKLSGGQITALALATALVIDPKVLILDEPDSHLDQSSRDILADFIKKNKGRLTFILISQYPESAKNADRCLILEDGYQLFLGPADQLFQDEPLKEKSRLFPKSPKTNESKANHPGKYPDRFPPILSLKNVSFSYDKVNSVIRDINLEIYPGEKIGLAGLSGSGKSTLGLLMAGLLKPERGEIILNNSPIQKLPIKQLRQAVTMSMQFPERALIGHTVKEDIAFGPINLEYPDIENQVAQKLRQFRLENLGTRHPFTLSGGQKRRAGLAGIMAIDSSIVILDEPTAAMDPQSTAEFIEWLDHDMDHTFVIISHDQSLFSSVCQSMIYLKTGEMMEHPIFERLANEF